MKSWKFITYNQLGKQSDVCRECVKVHEDDTHIIGCLCDGLGSPENAQIAAEVATDTVIEMFSTIQSSGDITKNDVRQVKEAVVTAVKTRLKKTAEEKKLELDALDCTLLFVCVFKEEDIAVIGNLGESALCVIGNTDARLFGNGTVDGKAVLDDNAVQRLYMTIIRLDDNVKGFLLSSDGLESEVYYKGQEFVGKSAEIYFNVVLEEDPQKAMQEKVAELTDDPEAGFNDDISLAVISCTDEAVTLPDEPVWPCVCGNSNPLYEDVCAECGREFAVLYKNVNLSGGKARFFRSLQLNPTKRDQLTAALRRDDAQASKQTTKVIPMASIRKAQQEAAEETKEEEKTIAADEPAETPEAPEAPETAAPASDQEYIPDVEEFETEKEPKERKSFAEVLKSTWPFLLAAFVIGALLSGIITAVVKDAVRANEAPLPVPTKVVNIETTAPANTGVPVASTTSPASSDPSQPASQPANGSNADIAGVWRIDHFVVGGEKVSGDSGIGLTYIYTFNADGSVTRDSGVIETGSYVRDGNVITASFGDGDYEFEYSAAAKSMTVEMGDVTSVYGKDGQPVQDVTEPATSAELVEQPATDAPIAPRGQQMTTTVPTTENADNADEADEAEEEDIAE